MQVLILAAGYGTRLARDIRNDESGAYTHLLQLPKPLLPLGGVPLISRWVEDLHKAGIASKDIFVVTNAHFHDQFVKWAESGPGGHAFPPENIVNDETKSNEERLGAVRDIRLVIDRRDLSSHLIVVGGDTLFFDDFDLPSIATKRFAEVSPASVVMATETKTPWKSGILELNESRFAVNFLEKPKEEETTSRLSCPCFYVLHKDHAALIPEYVDQATTLKEVDAPGSFIQWLINTKKSKVYAEPVSGRFDVGGLTTYIEADKHYTSSL